MTRDEFKALKQGDIVFWSATCEQGNLYKLEVLEVMNDQKSPHRIHCEMFYGTANYPLSSKRMVIETECCHLYTDPMLAMLEAYRSKGFFTRHNP